MLDFIAKLFLSDGFTPRKDCGEWTPLHIGMDVLGDAVLVAACLVLAFGLRYFSKKRGDLPVPALFQLFGIFVFCCGLLHLCTIVSWLWPGYRLLTIIKLSSAVVSVTAAVYFLPKLPMLLKLPSPAALADAAEERQRAAHDLAKAMQKLEHQLLLDGVRDREVQIMRNLSTAKNQSDVQIAVDKLNDVCGELRTMLTGMESNKVCHE